MCVLLLRLETMILVNTNCKLNFQSPYLATVCQLSLSYIIRYWKGEMFQCRPKSMSYPDRGFSKGCRPEDYRSFLVLTVSLSCFSYGLFSSLTLCTLDNEQFTLNSQGSTPAIVSPALLWSLQFLTSLSPVCLSYLASPYSSLKRPPIMYISILT